MWLLWFAAYGAFALLWPGQSGPERPAPGYAWFLVLILAPWSVWLAWRSLRRGRVEFAAVLIAGCAQLILIYPVHIIATIDGQWAYFEDWDRLLGIRYGGVPVEEFFFYPLMINLALLMYLLFRDPAVNGRMPDIRWSRPRLRLAFGGAAIACFAAAVWMWTRGDPSHVVPALQARDGLGVPRYLDGPLHRGWAVLCMGSAGANLLYLWWAETHTALHLRTLLIVTPVFMAQSFLVDLMGVSRGWWVFNAQACSGAWIGPLPAEGVPMYATGVMLSISLYESARRLLGGGAR